MFIRDSNLSLTAVGPANSTEMIALNIYNTAFKESKLGQAQTKAVEMCIRDSVCTIIIFVVIVAAGLAIAVVTTLIGRIITNSITEPVEQIEAAVASLRKGELSNVEMLTYESEDELEMCIRDRIRTV